MLKYKHNTSIYKKGQKRSILSSGCVDEWKRKDNWLFNWEKKKAFIEAITLVVGLHSVK